MTKRIYYNHEQHELICRLQNAIRLMIEAVDSGDQENVLFVRHAVLQHNFNEAEQYFYSNFKEWVKKEREFMK